MSLQLEDQVGSYRIVGVLGAGGVGQVFKVQHTITGRIEAMKVLLSDHHNTAEQAQRFQREIQLQASLAHPNIAAVHNAFWAGDHLVMIMELVEGESLQDRLERGPLALPQSIDYACQALAALSYAHARGVTHRDITPANMIITPQGSVKLTDFGLAKATSDPRLTQTGIVMGSLYYMSPEQVKASHDLDARTDLYSLGVVLYEMAVGSRPFQSDNSFALMLAHVEQAPQPPSERKPDLPAALNDAILKALAKGPGDRFQSAGEFRDALEPVKRLLEPERGVTFDEKPGRANGTRVPQPDRRPESPNPGGAAASEAEPLAAPGHSPEGLAADEQQPARLKRLSAAEPCPGERPAARARRGWGALVAGKSVPRAVQAVAAVMAILLGAYLLRVARQSSVDETVSPAGAIESASAAPGVLVGPEPPAAPLSERGTDSSRVRSQPAASTPTRREPPEGEPAPEAARRESTESPSAPSEPSSYHLARTFAAGSAVRALALSPERRWLAAATANHAVEVWELASGNKLATLAGHKNRIVALGFRSDGRLLASASWDGTARIWDLDTGTEIRRLDHKSYVTSVAFSPDGRRLATGDADKTVRIWELYGDGSPRKLRGHQRAPQALAFSPDGSLLASVAAEPAVLLWSLDQGGSPEKLAGPKLGATAVAFSPDGASLAAAGSGALKIWNVGTLRETQQTAISGWLQSIAFAPGGRCFVFSASSDEPQAARLWDAAQAKELSTVSHSETVRSLVLSADGDLLAAAGDQGTISLWPAQH